MKIIFFTQEDPFYVKVFFDEFFANYKRLDEINAVVISNPMGKKSLFDLAKQMYGLYGPLNFIRVGFKYVYYKLMSKRKISKSVKSVKSDSVKILKTYSIKQTADSYGIKAIERSDLNSKDFISLIKRYDADLFISIASPIIFKEQLIKIPKLDCINIHNAPLPKYRGMLPNFWQLYHGEKEAGITVHKIEKGIDTGDIILQQYVPIETTETLNDLIIKTKKKNAWMIMDTIEDFRNSRVQYKRMEGKGSYFTFPTSKDVKEFIRRGKKIL